MKITLAGGQTAELLADRAVWLAESASLLIADLHLGKAQSFRSQAIPVPGGTTGALLARLDRLLIANTARELIILGDFIHDARSDDAGALSRFTAWLSKRPDLAVHVVPGNHDRKARSLLKASGIHLHEGGLARAGVALLHEPDGARQSFAIAGHLHPVAVLNTRLERVRLPCFWLRARSLVIPAFGEFTGGFAVKPEAGERLFVADGERVHEVRGTERRDWCAAAAGRPRGST